jgi:hypothetical protein
MALAAVLVTLGCLIAVSKQPKTVVRVKCDPCVSRLPPSFSFQFTIFSFCLEIPDILHVDSFGSYEN